MDMNGDVRLADDHQPGKAKWQSAYETQVAVRRAQIDGMIAFAESTDCRMHALVQHFGDTADKATTCGLCDICNPGDTGSAQTAHQPTRAGARLAPRDPLRPRTPQHLHRQALHRLAPHEGPQGLRHAPRRPRPRRPHHPHQRHLPQPRRQGHHLPQSRHHPRRPHPRRRHTRHRLAPHQPLRRALPQEVRHQVGCPIFAERFILG